MGRLGNIAAAASAIPEAKRLENELKLEYHYQLLTNPEANGNYLLELGYIDQARLRALLNKRVDKDEFKHLRGRLYAWSQIYGTYTESASEIMEYKELENYPLVRDRKKAEEEKKKKDEKEAKKQADKSSKNEEKERKKNEEKAKKQTDKPANRDTKKKAPTSGKTRGVATGSTGRGSHRG
ncbi:uncharacterized protein EAE97_005779 [Botrytis byssoidea]|uniref:Uncharacterized protein n=1 Tax=Botrytis byssoidea TaxID=139641 RepID=A0A9P5IP68_9HELO|nr:uncharacterized protein EAE97_005779 [Botrytis byssoidea]KAF7943709.1 hypothetical protein EAE97_005779 [Botrytis byssoidea]